MLLVSKLNSNFPISQSHIRETIAVINYAAGTEKCFQKLSDASLKNETLILSSF